MEERNSNSMELIIKNANKEAKITIDEDLDIYDILEEIAGLLVAWGYQEKSVRDGFIFMGDEYTDINKEDYN